MTEPSELAITQADRDASWNYADFHYLPDSQMRERWFAGYYDNLPQGHALRAFATHRIKSLSAMTDPLAMAKAMQVAGCSCQSGERLCDHCCMVDDFAGRVPLNGTICVPDALYRRVCRFLAIDPATLGVDHATD